MLVLTIADTCHRVQRFEWLEDCSGADVFYQTSTEDFRSDPPPRSSPLSQAKITYSCSTLLINIQMRQEHLWTVDLYIVSRDDGLLVRESDKTSSVHEAWRYFHDFTHFKANESHCLMQWNCFVTKWTVSCVRTIPRAGVTEDRNLGYELRVSNWSYLNLKYSLFVSQLVYLMCILILFFKQKILLPHKVSGFLWWLV